MPTFRRTETFLADYRRLSIEERDRAKTALLAFRDDVTAQEEGTLNGFRPSLRVKKMQDNPGIFEMTWEGADGRATFEYGNPITPGKRHVVWRRIGSHAIFRDP